jgi:hypothetical protein
MATLKAPKYLERLDRLRTDSEGWNPALCGIIRSGRGYNLSDDEIRRDIVANSPERISKDRLNEIDRAFSSCGAAPPPSTAGEPRNARIPSQVLCPDPKPRREKEKPQFTPWKLEQFARRCDGFDFADLIARSPIRPHTRTPVSFLHPLYRPGEQVIVFDKFISQGLEILTRGEDLERFDATALDHLIKPAKGLGAWFLANPVDGKTIFLDRLKSEKNPEGRTRRSEDNLTAFRYLVLESDKADPLLWLAALVQLPLKIAAVYSSGGKSIHALVRVDARDKAHFVEIKESLAPLLVTLGADDGAMTAVRLTRLPQCYRAEKDRWQELYFLNPNPTETPIHQLPTQP